MEPTENARKRKAEEEPNTSNAKVTKIEEINPPNEPLENEAKEIRLYNKMREEAVQDMKKHFDVGFVRDYLLGKMKALTAEEFAANELEIYYQSMKHPGMLRYTYLPNGKFMVYQGQPRKNWHPLCINGSFEVDDESLTEPPEDPLEDYNI